MKRRCLNCMKEFNIPAGGEDESNVCPYCGFVENTRPKVLYHLFPGTVLKNRYTIGVVLGSGGFGVTYKAWDSVLGIVVAIKEYYPATFVQRVPGTKDVIVYDGSKRKEFQDSLERFMEEAQNTAKFDNPNIVHVDNYFEENNTAYIVMEFLEGISLKDYLKMNGDRIDIKDIDYIFLPIMDALKSIHEQGIIHRDVSPDNIFLCDQGEVKLIDFGAARFSDSEKEKTRSIILKPGYAPPEQYQSKSVQGPWTDLYALSATLYRVITGKDPVESVNRFSEEFVKKKDLLVEPKVYLPEIPENLNNTIVKGMSIEPALRFRTVEEFEAAYKGKKVITPYEARNRKLIRRAIGISVAAFIIAVGAFFVTRMYRDKKKAVDLEAATITVWIPYEDTMSEQDAKSYGEILISDFKNEYQQIDVEVTVVPENDYSKKLKDASESGSLPTIFISDDEPDDLLKQTIQMKGALDYIELSDLNYLGKFESELSNCHSIPTGYYLPVVYVRTNVNDVDAKNIIVSSIADLKNANGFYVDEKYLEITAKTLGVSEEELQKAGKKASLDDFVKNKDVIYYLATTAEYDSLCKKAAGEFEMRPYDVDVVYAETEDCWSISASASESEKIAAEVLEAYIFMDSVQQRRWGSGYNSSFPFDKTAYKAFMGVNGKYMVVDEYKEIDFGTFR